MKDPYETLGVAPDASAEDIRKAYRRLAKKLHPDLNPGDKKSEESFKEVSGAYDLLSDADKRRRFDAGEIDASGSNGRANDFTRISRPRLPPATLTRTVPGSRILPRPTIFSRSCCGGRRTRRATRVGRTCTTALRSNFWMLSTAPPNG